MITFDNPLDWAPASAFHDGDERVDGKWWIRRGFYGATGDLIVASHEEQTVPELRIEPNLTGWHDVAVRIYHGNPYGRGYGAGGFNGVIHAGTTNDRALRILRPEVSTETFETLRLGPRDMTGAALRLDGSFHNCFLDSVSFTSCDPPAALPPADKEVCAVLDFADAPDDYRPIENCAAECVKMHAEAGFTTLFWKAYAVRCEYHTKIAERRRAEHQPHKRVNIGHVLDVHDSLAAAVEEAHNLDLKILGWMRINNEMNKKPGTGTAWIKFSDLPAFHNAHPEMRQRKKDGELVGRLSFAFPEVRQYLCSIAREILGYGVDGLMIDVLRHPPMVQYDKPLVDAFIEQTGEDPMQMDGFGTEAWLRFRATAFTSLLADLRQMMNDNGYKDLPIYVRAMPDPWRLLRDGCDLDAWCQQGIVDTFVAGHHCIVGPGHPSYFDLSPLQNLIAGRCRLIAQVMRNSELHTALALAQQAYDQGADGSAIYETNHTVTLPGYRAALPRLRHTKV